MVYNYVLRRASSDHLVLRFGNGSRFFFGMLGGLVAYGAIADRRLGAFAGGVMVILFIAALYLERWDFDRRTGDAVYASGLIFAQRTKRYPLADLREVVLRGAPLTTDEPSELHESFDHRRQRPVRRGFTKLCLRFEAYGTVDIQLESNRKAATLRTLGNEIARFCNIPYREAE